MMKGLSKMKLKQAAKAALSASPLILGMAATAPAQYYVSHAACGIASGILVCNTQFMVSYQLKENTGRVKSCPSGRFV
jgi:hypothetical protein